MAKAKKLPSGQWRTLVYSHTDPATKKRKYKSFTADSKWESESLAAEYRNKQKNSIVRNDLDLTVEQAMDRYITSKENVLSPATVREYIRSSGRDLKMLQNIKLRDLTQELIQRAINEEAKTKAPKTVRNIHGFLSAAINMFYPEFKLDTTLPKKRKIERHIPIEDDVKKLMKTAEGKEVEIPILLAATGSLRRSEISAVRQKNVTDTGIYIKSAIVQDKDKKWVEKIPKTDAGYRFCPLPAEIVKKLRAVEPIDNDDRIVRLNPNQIYNRFQTIQRRAGTPHIRFHDLRHYYASILHAIGVPDKYIMQYGGWSTDTVLKNVYQHVMDDKDAEEQAKVISHFSEVAKGD